MRLLYVSALPWVLAGSLILPSSGMAQTGSDDPPARQDPDTVIALEPMVVTATRIARSVKSLTGSVDVVARSELEQRQVTTVEEAFLERPGIDVVGSGALGQEVRLTLRGVTSGYGTQRALVMLDGRPLTDEYLGNVDLAQYPVTAMERLELVRGAASAAYGSNALGGVVNLIPRRGSAVPTTELSAGGGSFGTFGSSVAHGRRAGPVDVFVNLSGRRTDGYLRNTRDQAMDWEYGSGFVNVGYGGTRLSVRTYGAYFSGRGTDEEFARDVTRFSQDALATLSLDPERNASTSLRLYHARVDQTLGWFAAGDADYRQSATGAILVQTYQIHPAHHLLGGLEWRIERADVQEFAGPVDREAVTRSIFLQDEVRVGDALSFLLGLRSDIREDDDNDLTARAGANYRRDGGLIVRGSVGRAFRAPTISDRFLPTTSYFGVTFEGNPDLDSEVLSTAEAGVERPISEALTVGAGAFATRADGFWDYLRDPDGVFRPHNIARVRIRGLEAKLRARLTPGVEAATSYTFTDARYGRSDPASGIEEGKRLDDNVRHQAALSATYTHARGHTLRGGVHAYGDRFTDPANTPEGRLPSFYVASLRAGIQVTHAVALTLAVDNLFGTTYRTRREFPQPGRGIFVGLRSSF